VFREVQGGKEVEKGANHSVKAPPYDEVFFEGVRWLDSD
jgi:hypothetical protein